MAAGRRSFPAGLSLAAHKSGPMSRPLRMAPAPALAVVGLDQGGGQPASPAVNVGERVRIGSLVGRACGGWSVDVHSPVSGLVRAIEPGDLPGARARGPCVVIENDGCDELESGLGPVEWASLAPEDLLGRLARAGIAGLGGAAFPAHAKLAAARACAAVHLVLNGAECEPWICCDDALMRERAGDVLLGAQVMLRASGAARCTLAVEDDKPEAIAALERALAAIADPRLEIRVIAAVYPAGAERPLLAGVAGVEVPHDALPPEVGLLCHNVGTAAAVAEWARSGQPITHRIVTVTGSGVRQPGNLDARIGTRLADLVDACGGYVGEPLRLIAGGTMTGRALASDAVPVTQSLNCVVVATGADLGPRGPESPCIRCGDCATVCPAGLLPQSLLRAASADDADGLERHGIADCIECGCCDYVCPSRIPLTERFRRARTTRATRLDEQRRAREARERYAAHEQRRKDAAEAERQAFEAARRRARSGRED